MHERAQAGRNGGIVGRSETGCECGRHIAQEVISPRSGTEMQQQPRSLQIWHIRDAGEKTLLRFPLGSEDGSNVLVRTKRRAEDEETLAIAGERAQSPVRTGSPALRCGRASQRSCLLVPHPLHSRCGSCRD